VVGTGIDPATSPLFRRAQTRSARATASDSAPRSSSGDDPQRYSPTVTTTKCFGCGADVVELDGPVHAYMPTAPGCWYLYCSLQDWKNSLLGDEGMDTAQKVVDSYSAQHASNSDRRNRQSVAVHLMSLCASLEQGMRGVRLRSLLGGWTRRDYPELLPRPDAYPITVRDVADADDSLRSGVAASWAMSTWTSWSDHHDEVRGWLEEMTEA
jgi:hypothetical protein